MIDKVFDLCVSLLSWLAAQLGISYNAINVWIFCVVWPLFTIGLIAIIIWQAGRIHQLERVRVRSQRPNIGSVLE
jgi:hypothetical protein